MQKTNMSKIGKNTGVVITVLFVIAVAAVVVGSISDNFVKLKNNQIGNDIGKTVPTGADNLEKYIWYNGDREEQVFAALDEVAIFPKNVSEKTNVTGFIQIFDPQAVLIKNYEFVVFVHLPNRLDRATLESKMAEFNNTTGSKANFVFYRGPTKDQAPMALTGEIIVKFKPEWDETKVKEWAKNKGLDIVKSFPFSPNTYLFNVEPGLRSLEIANQIYLSGQVVYAYPNWWKAMALKNNQTIHDTDLNDVNISKENETTPNSSKKVPFLPNIVAVVLIILTIYIHRRK